MFVHLLHTKNSPEGNSWAMCFMGWGTPLYRGSARLQTHAPDTTVAAGSIVMQDWAPEFPEAAGSQTCVTTALATSVSADQVAQLCQDTSQYG